MPSALVNEKCVSAFEFKRMTPRPSWLSGGTIIGKAVAQRSSRRLERKWLCHIGKSRHLRSMSVERDRQALANAPRGTIHHANTVALDEVGRRQEPQPAQTPVGTGRKIKPCGICAIDDVEIVIAGQDQNAFRQLWMRLQRVEQLRPLSGTACICQIARDQDDVDRMAWRASGPAGRGAGGDGRCRAGLIVRSRSESHSARRPHEGPTGARRAMCV